MTLPFKLNATQVGVLQWVADGSPPDVMTVTAIGFPPLLFGRAA